MGISILGIIAVQLVWMNNAINVKNELFNRSVNTALQKTVNRLEDIHNFEVVNEMVFQDSLLWRGKIDEDFDFKHIVPPVVRPGRAPIVKPPRPVRIIREIKPGGKNTQIEIRVDTDKNDSSNLFSYRYNVQTSGKNRNTSGNVIVLHTDTFFTNIDSLYEVSYEKLDSLMASLDTLNFLEQDFTKRAKIKASKLKDIASQVVTEIYDWDSRKIDGELIQEVLAEELENNNIPINFQTGIIRGNGNVTFEGAKDSSELVSSPFQVNLYPNDVFQKNIKLSVYFPGREKFIFRSLNWLLIASFLFSLFILSTFLLSVYYILRQKKISKMKSDFINNMTHEFKTPIATISVATDSILNEKVLSDPDRIRYFTKMIKKENTRMNRQVEDILTIARLDKKDFEFTWEAVDVHELIEDAIQGIKLQIEKRGGTIDVVLNAVNSVVITDKMHSTNVIYNLLDNANKYSAEAPRIKISTLNKINGVIIAIEDQGIGMTKTVQSKIFERFYRQASGNIHNVKGFGLGLSYVKAVLEANHGHISVQSLPGKGSKFEVFLPFVRE